MIFTVARERILTVRAVQLSADFATEERGITFFVWNEIKVKVSTSQAPFSYSSLSIQVERGNARLHFRDTYA